MERQNHQNLLSWLQKRDRKPLVIRGARQVGKTWLVRNFAQKVNKKLVEVNFERDPQLKKFFDSNDPKKILLHLSQYTGQAIDPQSALLFLDEIQAAPEVLAKLRWFYEEIPELPLLAAGSLLDFVLEEHQFSMPVGRISYLHLEPMSFEEFLLALGRKSLLEHLHHYVLSDLIPEPIHQLLTELFKTYLIVGGMPAVVKSWIQDQDLMKVLQIQQELMSTFRDDFNKYNRRLSTDRLEDILTSIPRQLGKKFTYRQANPEVPYLGLKQALRRLCTARLAHRVWSSDGSGVPLAAGIREKKFKIILLDVGLVSSFLGLLGFGTREFTEISLGHLGALSEQFVGQQLRTMFPSFMEPSLYYWGREQKGSEAEVDYLIQHQDQVVPIEVKSGSTGTLKSLHLFMQIKKLTRAIRINGSAPNQCSVKVQMSHHGMVEYQLISLPFYLVGQIHRLLLR